MAGVFQDADVSASGNAPRPELDALVAAMDEGKANVLVAWKLDRAFRNNRDAHEFLEPRGRPRRHFVSVDEGFDTSTDYGD